MRWVLAKLFKPLHFCASSQRNIVCYAYVLRILELNIFSAIWGPFLVISPASTLHNWQQEFARFTPKFKVIPYWGNPQVNHTISNEK